MTQPIYIFNPEDWTSKEDDYETHVKLYAQVLAKYADKVDEKTLAEQYEDLSTEWRKVYFGEGSYSPLTYKDKIETIAQKFKALCEKMVAASPVKHVVKMSPLSAEEMAPLDEDCEESAVEQKPSRLEYEKRLLGYK